MLTTQTPEIPLISMSEDFSNQIKRNRVNSHAELGVESQKKSKNQYNHIKMIEDQKQSVNNIMKIEDQKQSEQNLMKLIEELMTKQSIFEKKALDQMKQLQEKSLDMEKKNTRMANTLSEHRKTISQLESTGPESQRKIAEQSIMIKNLQSQVTTIQKKLNLAQKSIDFHSGGGKILEQSKEKIGSSVETTTRMTQEEEEIESRKGYDYGPMKGNEGWIDPVEIRQESAKRRGKETKQSASIVKEVPLKIAQKNQNTEGSSQTTYLQKLKKDIKSAVDPSSLLLKKETTHLDGPIMSWTLRIELTNRAKNFCLLSMLAVIEQTTGKKPLSISVINASSAQICFREEDLLSFQKLLTSKMIKLVETKKDNFQQADIVRLAHLYLSGYYKDLAHAAVQNLPVHITTQILTKAATLVKQRFKNVPTQKRWNFIIKKDLIAFQPPQEGMEIPPPI
jgi:hypothetical protein